MVKDEEQTTTVTLIINSDTASELEEPNKAIFGSPNGSNKDTRSWEHTGHCHWRVWGSRRAEL